MRVAVVAVTVALVAAAAAGCGSSHPAHTASGGAAPGSTAAPADLTAQQQKYVTALQAALAAVGQTTQETPAQLAATGKQACAARQSGQSQASLGGNPDGKIAVRVAEKVLCPQYLPQVLIRMSGSGIKDSAPFVVNSGTVTVRYTFDCSGFGQAGNFSADLETGNQASLGSDDQSIANQLAMRGHATTTVYPENPGSEYHVSVDSECSWSLVARSS